MRLDVDSRATTAMVFGLFCLAVQLLGSMFGLPVNATLVGTFGTIVLASFGVGVVLGSKSNGEREK